MRKALANHRRIKRLLSCGCENEKVLNLLEEEFGTYIRFEERVLYNEIRRVVNPEKLEEIEKHHDRIEIPVDAWKDPFWEE